MTMISAIFVVNGKKVEIKRSESPGGIYKVLIDDQSNLVLLFKSDDTTMDKLITSQRIVRQIFNAEITTVEQDKAMRQIFDFVLAF